MPVWIRKLVSYTSSSKGAKITLSIWLIAVVALSIFAPGSKDYEVNSTEGSIGENTPSEIADKVMEEEFPTDEGLTALLAFHKQDGLSGTAVEDITAFSEWLASNKKPEGIASALPFHDVPEQVQEQMLSDDDSTLLFNLALEENISASESNDLLQQLRDKWEVIGSPDIQFEITGPAGISADTVSLFQNADFVLMFATIILIFIILIFIYRSPLLAITPLLIAGIVYGVVDRVLGILGKYDLFSIEGQAVSIMLVLLFAVVTDYSLFIFSRYREELRTHQSKYDAMNEAISHVGEPIFFSGGTVTLAMLTLFVTVFKPYHNFAPVFTIAVIFILIAGLTLIPALFALLGRKAFWPKIPKVSNEKEDSRGFWNWASNKVIKHPVVITSTIIVFLAIGAVNALSIPFSFNLLKSFPDDISSRVGFELLEDNYAPGDLAPATIVLESEEDIDNDADFLTHVQTLQNKLEDKAGISEVSSTITDKMIQNEEGLPKNFLADSKQSVKFQFTVDSNPYDRDAIETVDSIRSNESTLLQDSGFTADNMQLHIAGQTAHQLDVKDMNKRDMIVLFSIVIVALTIILGIQTKSILLPSLMMGTIIVSYISTLGFGWLIFHYFMGYEEISYRLPVYTFIFMVALGIDYNIMLVSRIKEFAKSFKWKEAIQKGVAATGAVISSAGLILAATFSVLITQPIQELFLFGFIMAMGILLDTFIIRGFLLPSILVLTRKKK